MSGSGEDRMTVLCVDDDEAFLELEVEMLELRADDVDAVPVSSAPAALDVLAERDVDCVVSDFDMPEMTGLEFLEAVTERFRRLPFILHTGKGSEEIASEAISAGVADYIQKSGGAEQYDLLANRIRNAVGHTRESVQRERTEQWYRQLFEQRIIGVAISQDGEFVQANQKFADILGYDRSDVVGMTAMDVVAADDRDRVARALRKREDGEVDSIHYVVTAVRADGERVDLEVNGGRVDYGGDPAVLGLVLPVSEHARVVRPTVSRGVRDDLRNAAAAIDATDRDDHTLDGAHRAVERALDVLGVDSDPPAGDGTATTSLADACNAAWSRFDVGPDANLEVRADAAVGADEAAVAAFVEDVVEVALGRWPTDCTVVVEPVDGGFSVRVASPNVRRQAAADLLGADAPRLDPVTDVASRHGWDVMITTLGPNTVEYTLELAPNGSVS
ncbi:PAS domain S-box protein [Halobacterium bonnevillei]|uniref:PAS domain S-box protein n=1 Tax=Halobacterium bonnevillei TaxID=2692200 RepID=A0A6B0SJJ5_9EURY|nr:PAS domain S-box protein [Halobacterium bonnevillei]MXR21984.1 PAS domain S-box protein [Halobacterium bonnevillei]